MAASVEVDPDALDGGLEAPTPKDAQRSEELKSSANQAFQAGKFAQVLRLALAGCGVPDATRCAWTKMLVDQTPPQSIMDCWHVSSASRPTPSFRGAALHSPFHVRASAGHAAVLQAVALYGQALACNETAILYANRAFAHTRCEAHDRIPLHPGQWCRAAASTRRLRGVT